MLAYYYRVNLRLCGGPLHGYAGEFNTNLTPGEIMRVPRKGHEPAPYVILDGPAITFAISSGSPNPSLCGNAVHISILPESQGVLN